MQAHCSAQVYEADGDKTGIFLKILESGYLLVLQGQESFDTIPLLYASDSCKVHQKSDNLMFRFTLKGESRMMRMQFDGSSKAEAIKQCSSAVKKLMEYLPVTTQQDTLPASNQTPAGDSVPVKQVSHFAIQTIKMLDLSSIIILIHFLGGTAVTLPQVYRHSSLAHIDLEPVLRLCLLDPSFPAFVENVEGELRKLLEE
ncbi:meiotic recombination protein REC114 [Labrus mixtus]|uniref:meiotic recombination protein REC114 n=1 Tax=Labrus mixtus TaxID=508554 RepID=UPI0029C09CEB|nr:meiotic recombination protein REC114 [Labrus mixtus]